MAIVRKRVAKDDIADILPLDQPRPRAGAFLLRYPARMADRLLRWQPTAVTRRHRDDDYTGSAPGRPQVYARRPELRRVLPTLIVAVAMASTAAAGPFEDGIAAAEHGDYATATAAIIVFLIAMVVSSSYSFWRDIFQALNVTVMFPSCNTLFREVGATVSEPTITRQSSTSPS